MPDGKYHWIIELMLPQLEDNLELYELQFALAYSQIILPISSEEMTPSEMIWWYKKLIEQKEIEEKEIQDLKGSGKNKRDKDLETIATRASFGFTKVGNKNRGR